MYKPNGPTITDVAALEDVGACDGSAVDALDLVLDLGILSRVVHARSLLPSPRLLFMVNAKDGHIRTHSLPSSGPRCSRA